MSAALITATALAIVVLGASTVVAFLASTSADVLMHTSLGIFGTLMVLLSHSMTMFYLIGKGKAIREAVTEGGLSREFVTRMSEARRAVFSWATLAILITMTAAILGGGVDTGALPPLVHSIPAVLALAVNVAALRVEVRALGITARLVTEINQLLEAQSLDAG
jgi:hypothetical protein